MDKVYRAHEITGEEEGESIAGRLWMPEEEALALRNQRFLVEVPDGRRISAHIVGETPEQVVIEKKGGEVLVHFVGTYEAP